MPAALFEVDRIDNGASCQPRREPLHELKVDGVCCVLLQPVFVSVLGDQRDVPRVGLVSHILTATQAQEARNLTTKVTKSGEDLVGLVTDVQREHDDMGKHDRVALRWR